MGWSEIRLIPWPSFVDVPRKLPGFNNRGEIMCFLFVKSAVKRYVIFLCDVPQSTFSKDIPPPLFLNRMKSKGSKGVCSV